MSERRKILIFLAAYQGEYWIRQQVLSLSQQDGEFDVHVLVSDDGSKDSTMRVFRESAEEYGVSYSECHNKVPSGSSAANFFSLIKKVDPCEWDYFFFCDQDDIWSPGKIGAAISKLEETGADGYSCAVMAFWPDGCEKKLSQSGVVTKLDFVFEGGGQGCTFALRPALFKDVKDFIEDHDMLISDFKYHDWLIYLISRCHGFAWYFDQTAYCAYRQHVSNVIGAKGRFAGVFSRMRLLKSGWYKAEVAKAIRIADEAGASGKVYGRFRKFFLEKNSIRRYIVLMYLIFFYSRRKKMERMVLFFAVVFFWI